MVRKTILALLVFLLLILSGVDLLQDFDLPILAEIDSPIQNNNTLESGISAPPLTRNFLNFLLFNHGLKQLDTSEKF